MRSDDYDDNDDDEDVDEGDDESYVGDDDNVDEDEDTDVDEDSVVIDFNDDDDDDDDEESSGYEDKDDKDDDADEDFQVTVVKNSYDKRNNLKGILKDDDTYDNSAMNHNTSAKINYGDEAIKKEATLFDNIGDLKEKMP